MKENLAASNSVKQIELSQQDLVRTFTSPEVKFSSYNEMLKFLENAQIDLDLANSKKGLEKLWNKIQSSEARIVVDERSGTVFRAARAASLEIEAVIHGAKYQMVELCQIFLNSPITEQDILSTDESSVAEIISQLDIRSAQVRDSRKLWETLGPEENAQIGARRGLIEELNFSYEEAAQIPIKLQAGVLEYEEPIDWPGIPSILEIFDGVAEVPESLSKPAYVELEGNDQITIFVATPSAPLVQALLAQIIPNIHYVPGLSK